MCFELHNGVLRWLVSVCVFIMCAAFVCALSVVEFMLQVFSVKPIGGMINYCFGNYVVMPENLR